MALASGYLICMLPSGNTITRNAIDRRVETLEPPSAVQRQEALSLSGSRKVHDRLLASWPCLSTIETSALTVPVAPLSGLTVTAWNMERCKQVEQIADVIAGAGADVVLATEMDRGMARSGQRDTPGDLAGCLGWGYAFGVEFVELGLGDVRETRDHAGEINRQGLRGNAILSRYRIDDVRLLPLEANGDWFVGAPKDDGQVRVGGRVALAARLATEREPVVIVAVHYESQSDSTDRARQTRRLLECLAKEFGDTRCIIGGDLNTKGFLLAGLTGSAMLDVVAETEPSFAHFAAEGFDWRHSNTGAHTTRLHPEDPPGSPLTTLDWLLVRGVHAGRPFVVPACGANGRYLSDHEMVGATVWP